MIWEHSIGTSCMTSCVIWSLLFCAVIQLHRPWLIDEIKTDEHRFQYRLLGYTSVDIRLRRPVVPQPSIVDGGRVVS